MCIRDRYQRRVREESMEMDGHTAITPHITITFAAGLIAEDGTATPAPDNLTLPLSVLNTGLYLKRDLHERGLAPIPEATRLLFADEEVPDHLTLESQGVQCGALLRCVFDEGVLVSVKAPEAVTPVAVRVWGGEGLGNMLRRVEALVQDGAEERAADGLAGIWFVLPAAGEHFVRLSDQDRCEHTVEQTPEVSEGCVLVLEKSRRELTQPVRNDCLCAVRAFPQLCSCEKEFFGMQPVVGKFSTPCGEVPARKWKLLIWGSAWMALLTWIAAAVDPCMLPAFPSALTLLGLVLCMVPCMVLSASICCGAEFNPPNPHLGPLSTSYCYMRPVVYWNVLLICFFVLGFCCVAVTDVLWYECDDSELKSKGAEKEKLNSVMDGIGYMLMALSGVMAALAAKWLRSKSLERKLEERYFTYNHGDSRVLALLVAPIAQVKLEELDGAGAELCQVLEAQLEQQEQEQEQDLEANRLGTVELR
eukprot:TRINITY_DN3452_c0_g1_i1.p1 TRINITY_DN3452_c0_g1~~TRINITY_DN3452_c0_g1_i1.p1  ORF type:complete len:477 (+),score=114.53 TRINITY_DN3452_c0_g1_i1:84-1514(+)